MPDQKFSRDAVRYVLIIVIDNPHFQPGSGAAKRPSANVTRLLIVDQDPYHFGHSPDFNQRKAKSLLKTGMELWFDAGPNCEADFILVFVISLLLPEKHRYDDAKVVDNGGTAVRHLAPPALGSEPVALDLAVSSQEGTAKGQHRR